MAGEAAPGQQPVGWEMLCVDIQRGFESSIPH